MLRRPGPRAVDTLLTILSWHGSALRSLQRAADAAVVDSEAHTLAVQTHGVNSEQALLAASNWVTDLRRADRPGEALDVAIAILDLPDVQPVPAQWRVRFAGEVAHAQLEQGLARDSPPVIRPTRD